MCSSSKHNMMLYVGLPSRIAWGPEAKGLLTPRDTSDMLCDHSLRLDSFERLIIRFLCLYSCLGPTESTSTHIPVLYWLRNPDVPRIRPVVHHITICFDRFMRF